MITRLSHESSLFIFSLPICPLKLLAGNCILTKVALSWMCRCEAVPPDRPLRCKPLVNMNTMNSTIAAASPEPAAADPVTQTARPLIVSGGMSTLLEKTGLFSASQIDMLLQISRREGVGITDIVVREGIAREEDYLQGLSEAARLPFLRLSSVAIEPAVIEKLSAKVVFQYNVIPYALEDGALVVVTHDPFVPGLADALRIASGMRIRFVLATSIDIARAAKKFYGVGAETVARMIQDDRIEVVPEDILAKSDIGEDDQEASIVKFVNQVIWEAYQERATDIHFEPMENELRIRYRVDGVLHPAPLPPQLNRFQAAIISRIKVMANMDIAEKRMPQDGRIGLRIQTEDIDIRVSTMPTVYGESVSLRLLMRGKSMIRLDELGMSVEDRAQVEQLIHKPNGILLVTGPTGSGKSTSLYAYLREINAPEQRIITVEDPIEYEMGGINQINVRSDIGLTFATALRHILRQDPDVIMVGEIRDFETAEIAIRAALTGHLVFSTLHTNDAAGAITRLIDMGVEPFLVASSVEAIIAQRLVRRLCPDCRQSETPDHAFLESIAFPLAELGPRHLYTASGCEKCRMTGFRGRVGIYELLRVDERIEAMIVERASAGTIKQYAMDRNLRTLRDDGWLKAMEGITTVAEVVRVTETETVEVE